MDNSCCYCHQIHVGKCPLVKALEYHPDGTMKRVEFYAPNDYAPALFANPGPAASPFPLDHRATQIT